MTRNNKEKKQSGFALLMTIIVISVVISVTLTIVDLSLKQLQLASDNTDSETAFYAANAGLECARYTRNFNSDVFEAGNDVIFNCFGKSPISKSTVPAFKITKQPDSAVYQYKATFTWGDTNTQRCSEINIITIFATSTIDIGGSGANSLTNYISGYENDSKTCESGTQCTILSVVGYSSPCNATTSPSTLRREILLEF